MNFRNGNRQVLDDPKQKRSENQVSLAKVLATLPPKIDIRYAVPGYAGFEVRLPGQEKKLASFTGKLISIAIKAGQKGITISVKNGKVVSSEWLKPLDNRR